MGISLIIDSLLKEGGIEGDDRATSMMQTHISYLIFTPKHVYKIKKAVDFGFLDFTTLAKRKHFCEEEVRLNRRLSHNVYLGILPITSVGEGFKIKSDTNALNETSDNAMIVDYAVKMRRLPDDIMLKEMIKNDTVTEGLIDRVAARIAAFHAGITGEADIEAYGSPDMIKQNTDENFSQTMPYIGEAISKERFEKIRLFTDEFLNNRALFEARIKTGHIRDCHGDIHSDHVYIGKKIDIIDCIEFNERFRYSDTVSDLAFLSMDLAYLSRGDLERELEETYFKCLGDYGGKELITLYKCYRAFIRGKVTSFKLSEPEISAPEKAQALLDATRYFHLAGQYAEGGVRPILTIVCGLPGSGKSGLSAALARECGMKHLSSDLLRKELAGIDPFEHRRADFCKDIYTREFTEKTYEVMTDMAWGLLKRNRSVLLDATFSNRDYLEKAIETARECGAEVTILECSASDETIKERLKKRENEETASDADYKIYLAQKKAYKKINFEYQTINTELKKSEQLFKAIRKIFN